ncbi:DegT/DnrJ/EryC1/StrS family aminotransferase [bacterium D16-51]|nr:DegT/DnrJ/EryC1/StrS family aminotransferase [bacterium D16-59]RKI59768.1 DegT/DnrJ/EryC1/StrS family aminotransferase [bacterium D16-51]
MEFRDLKRQYQKLKPQIDTAISKVLEDANFISGSQVAELEDALAEYAGRKYCMACGNGTDALTLALMALDVGKGDAVFVPDFTFFASGETPAFAGAVPVFVDVFEDTFNMDPASLEDAILAVKKAGKFVPKVIIAVDLFGQPAEYGRITEIAKKYGLFVLEDAAQGFGGNIRGKMACSFGDISCTSFFPAKPLGCYGDGGAVFTDNGEWAALIRSYQVHGKGENKYDNVQIGINSRLDTIQAAILLEKFQAFCKYELEAVNHAAEKYTKLLKDIVSVPVVKEGYYSSWAQYSILLENEKQRDRLQAYLKEKGIPSMVYYQKPMHLQKAFDGMECACVDLGATEKICKRVLALPIHPYMEENEIEMVAEAVRQKVLYRK